MIDVSRLDSAMPDAAAFVRLLGLEPHRGGQRGGVRIFCPWHSEKHPSCDVTSKDGRIVAICRSCGGKGDALGLAATVWSLDAKTDFLEVAERLADAVGVTLERSDPAYDYEAPPVDHVAVMAELIERMACGWLRGQPPSKADDAAYSAGSFNDACQAVRRLLRADQAKAAQRAAHFAAVDAMTDEERDHALDEMAPRFATWGTK
jgi:hypothetical protein